MAVLSFIGLTVTTYWGGKPWDYYGLIFAAFCILGLIVWTEFLRSTKLFDLWHRWMPRHILSTALALSLVFSLLLSNTIAFNQNLYFSRYTKEDTVQYRFAKAIQSVDDATLLNYGFLDGGFYYASGAKPACRYFCYFNINSPEMWAEQNACIQNGETDFIVTRYYKLEQYGIDMSKYRLVDEASHPYDKNYSYTYYLYQRISE